MSKSALKKMQIEHLRGSIEPFSLTFEKGKNLTVIYGSNGAGKSTICDAFEFVGKGKVGSLEKRGLGKTISYWHSLGKKPSEVSVTLETEDSTCRATLNSTGANIIPYVGRPKVEVIRRAQILSSIEATPADRYSAIKPFIDISEIEACEGSLKDLIRRVGTDVELALTRVRENRDSIDQFWTAAGKPSPDSLKWAESETKQDIKAFEIEANSLDTLQKAFDRLTEYPKRFEEIEKGLKEAKDSFSTSQSIFEQSSQSISREIADTITILESTKQFLTVHPDPLVCPLCGSTEKVAGLNDRIIQRLEALTSLREAHTIKQGAEANVNRSKQRAEDLIKEAKRAASEFEKADLRKFLPKSTLLPSKPIPEDLSKWSSWIKEFIELPVIWKKAENTRRGKKQFISTLESALKTYYNNFELLKSLASLDPKLKEALKIVEDERKKYTDLTLSTIASEVGRLYEEVHPGEGLNKIRMVLDPKKRASLEMGASFLDLEGAPPQAYFSDSHLDTLGLCIFLALSALSQPDDTILVLDDVLGSIDEPHVERLIEMIYEESNKFRHCIITTHYQPWKYKLKWGWLKNGQCQFIELNKWTFKSGLTSVHSIPDIERLRQLIGETPPDLQLVCAKAGVILEAILDFLTQHYECDTPRKANGVYTLGDLLPAVDKRLRPALKVEVLDSKAIGGPKYTTIQLAPILEELIRISQARNVFGCHFNEISFLLLDSDAIDFGNNVLHLAETLIDEVAGWPKNGKSGNYWATAKETRRLYPYARPV